MSLLCTMSNVAQRTDSLCLPLLEGTGKSYYIQNDLKSFLSGTFDIPCLSSCEDRFFSEHYSTPSDRILPRFSLFENEYFTQKLKSSLYVQQCFCLTASHGGSISNLLGQRIAFHLSNHYIYIFIRR